MASFGHNARGVNLANLKAAANSGTPSERAFRNYNGYRILTDWKNEVQDEIIAASLTKDISNNIREQTKDLQETSDKQTTLTANKVEQALKQRVATVGKYKSSLETTLALVNDELSTLHRSELKLQKLVSRKQRQLDLNDQRRMTRTERPAREYTIDEVQSTLQEQNRMLSDSIENVRKCKANVQLEQRRLEQAKAGLEGDLRDKSAALEVDIRCLELCEKDSPTGRAKDSLGERGLVQNVVSHPHKWQLATEDILLKSATRQSGAHKLRDAIDIFLAKEDKDLSDMEEKVKCCLEAKIASGTKFKETLSSKLSEITEEIGRLESQKVELRASKNDKVAPLELGKQRYHLRKDRPDRELIHDDVEKALISEMLGIQSAAAKMDDKLNVVNKELNRLKQHASSINNNIKDKAKAVDVDTDCLELRNDFPISDNESVISVIGGPPRRCAKTTSQRMATLEEEISEVRAQREAMEKTLESMDEALSETL